MESLTRVSSSIVSLPRIEKRPGERGGQALHEDVLGEAAFASDIGEQRFGGTGVRGGTPRPAPVIELLRGRFRDRRNECFDRVKCHSGQGLTTKGAESCRKMTDLQCSKVAVRI